MKKKKPDAVYFKAYNFCGGWDTIRTEQPGGNRWMRLFRNSAGNSYWHTHAPPMYITNNKCMNDGNVISEDITDNLGINLYHYTCICDGQKLFKELYYQKPLINEKVTKFLGSHPTIINTLKK